MQNHMLMKELLSDIIQQQVVKNGLKEANVPTEKYLVTLSKVSFFFNQVFLQSDAYIIR